MASAEDWNYPWKFETAKSGTTSRTNERWPGFVEVGRLEEKAS